MKRLPLPETSDLPWFPDFIRRLDTEFLHFLFSTFPVYRPAAPLLGNALRHTGSYEILDLCSGTAGPLPPLKQQIEAVCGFTVNITLSDKYPPRGSRSGGAGTGIHYCPENSLILAVHPAFVIIDISLWFFLC